MSSFNKLGLSNWLLSTCEKIKYNTPTPIQSLTIPQILKGKSVIINSETGSGKTAAFGLPLLHDLSKDPTSIFAVIIAPSLELAMQIHEQMNIFGQGINLRQALIVGGVNYRMQYEQLEKYPHVVIATPGRLAELIGKSEKLVEELKRVEVLVLDEADRLFEEHLLPNMQRIIQAMPSLRQALLATATIDENF
jgi:ATP-dependent RNA helicase DDX49/DBP8